MLPIENLDKKSFLEISKEAKRNIHRFTSEWTDENYHDPGITFIEMFSWLTEMQRYYLNRITNDNHGKFLDLYGVNLEKQGIASTYVRFLNVNKNIILPKGVKIIAEEQIFETASSVMLIKNNIEKVLTVSSNYTADNSYDNINKDVFYYSFGEELNIGNKLYIGLSNLIPINSKFELYFNLFVDYAVKILGKNEFKYGVKGQWYSYTDNDTWEKIECIHDSTDMFTKIGTISLKLKKMMKETSIDASSGNHYWLMFEVESFGSHVSPKVEEIIFNTVKVENIDNKAKIINLNLNHGRAVIEEYLAINGTSILQYYKNGYWIDYEENAYSISKDFENQRVIIELVDIHEKVRIIIYDEDFKANSIIGTSYGLPNQSYKFKLENVITDDFIIQSGKYEDGKVIWKDFSYKKTLNFLSHLDCNFTCNFENDVIIFGNGQNGRIPFNFPDSLRVISFVKSNKERGNVKSGEINEFLKNSSETINIDVINELSAEGGKEESCIEDGREIVLNDFKEIHRAVTKEDYEYLVKNIPGVRIAFSKAIVNLKYENTVFVVVIPFTGKERPMPDKKLLNIVKEYLEDYRLITTNVKIIEPNFVEISIKCSLSTNNMDNFNKKNMIKEIQKYISPIGADYINEEYKIGETIYVSKILKILNGFSEVKYVKKIWIDGKGQDVSQDSNGNLFLPQNGICYCGKVEIDLVD